MSIRVMTHAFRAQVLIGGVDVAQLPTEDLRRHVAYVPAQPILFAGYVFILIYIYIYTHFVCIKCVCACTSCSDSYVCINT
jgi:hypothetical protein